MHLLEVDIFIYEAGNIHKAKNCAGTQLMTIN